MSNSNLTKLLTEYERKRLSALMDLDKRKHTLYKSNPRLQEIDNILSKEAIRISKLLITSNDSNLLKELNNKVDTLKKEKIKILNSLGLDESYIYPIYECKDCNDTGYILENYSTVMCHCLKQKLFDIEYNKSNIYNINKQNFESFSLDFYDDKIDEEKYHSKISPLENIKKIKKIAERFIENFDSENEKNLLFTGNTGLRKIFPILLYCQ